MKSLFPLLLTLFSTGLMAQTIEPQVIASSGGTGSSAQASLSWTIGEPITLSGSSSSAQLHSGFQQSWALSIPTSLQVDFDQMGITIYPNPASDWMYIDKAIGLDGTLSIEIMDLTGKSISPTTSHTQDVGTTRLRVTDLSAGIYIMILSLDSKPVGSFQFIKK